MASLTPDLPLEMRCLVHERPITTCPDGCVEHELYKAARCFATTDDAWSGTVLRHYDISFDIKVGTTKAPAGAYDLLRLWGDR